MLRRPIDGVRACRALTVLLVLHALPIDGINLDDIPTIKHDSNTLLVAVRRDDFLAAQNADRDAAMKRADAIAAKLHWLSSSAVTNHKDVHPKATQPRKSSDKGRMRGREPPVDVPSKKGDDRGTKSTQVGDGGNKGRTAQKQPSESEDPGSSDSQAGIIKKIFFINMDKDVKRRSHMENELSKYAANIPSERIPGQDPSTMRESEDFSRLMPRGCCADKNSETKCHNSDADNAKKLRSCACDFAHRIGFEKIASQPDEGYYLLLEDDIKFEGPSWLDQAKTQLQHAPKDWDILRLGFWGDNSDSHKIPGHQQWYQADRVDEIGQGWPNFKGYFGAHAIVMTPYKAQKFLTNHVVPAAGDYADAFTANKPGLKSYVSVKNLITPASEDLGSSRNDGTINRFMLRQHVEDG